MVSCVLNEAFLPRIKCLIAYTVRGFTKALAKVLGSGDSGASEAPKATRLSLETIACDAQQPCPDKNSP